MSNEQTFEKRIQQGTTSIYFKFIGTEKNSNIDYEKINSIIEACFSDLNQIDNLTKLVSWIRTILKDFEENYLEAEISQQVNSKEKIIYKNELINNYNKTINNQTVINYNSSKKPNLTLNTSDLELDNYYNYLTQSEFVNLNIGTLYALANVEPIKLTTDEEALCLFYEKFYNELPDFSDEDINIKMQIMMQILTNFGIHLYSIDEQFMLNREKNPISTELSNIIKNLIPLGKIEKISDDIELNYEVEIAIKTISNMLKKYISDASNEIESLKRINKIFYIGKNTIPTDAAIETIAEICKYSIEEVHSSLKLRRNIEYKIYN